MELAKRDREKYPLKNKIKIVYHGQRDTKCSDCGTIINLEFHHTDYKNNIGVTLCKQCHIKTHKEARK